MKPYYQDAAVTIYCGDCREIVPSLGGGIDLLLTDPPYGIGESSKKVASRQKKPHWVSSGMVANQRDYGEFSWDQKPIDQAFMDELRSSAPRQIIWGGNYYAFPASSCWLVWDKENGATDFADCELAWTNLPKAVRIIRHLWNGMLRKGQEDRFHPTQKPLDVISWCIAQAGEGISTILDPFAGSCTTGRAAKDLGKKAILIEREERYCEIGARRMAQEVLPLC